MTSNAGTVLKSVLLCVANRNSVKEAHREIVKLYGPAWMIFTISNTAENFGEREWIPSVLVQIIPMAFALPTTASALERVRTLEDGQVFVVVTIADDADDYEAFSLDLYAPHREIQNSIACAVDINVVKGPDRRFCSGCSIDFPGKLRKCAPCNITRYCSVVCQRSHRPVHRTMCGILMAIRTQVESFS
jgi:hypothetical protein